DLASGLRPRRHLDRMLTIDSRDGDRVAEHRLRHRHRELVQQVLTTPHEVRMWFHAEPEVQVAGGAATWAGLAFAGQSQRHVIVDAGGNGHLDGVPPLDTALATADRARIRDHLSLAVTRRARRDAGDLAEDRLHRPAHLSTALAGRALRGAGARFGAGAAALGALRRPRYLDSPLGAEDRLLEGDLDVHAQVVAALRTGVGPAPSAAPEEHVEEVERRVEREVAEIRLRAVADVAEGVVTLPLLRIAQDRVRLADLLELLLGSLVAVVAVRVVLHGELAIRGLQLLRRRVARNAEHLVVVALDGRHASALGGDAAGPHHAHDRGAEQAVAEAIARHELCDHGVLVDVVGFLGRDRGVDRGVEPLADRRNRDDADALERGLELANHELEAAHEEVLSARLAGMLDGTAQGVEHRQQSECRVLTFVSPRVGHLLGLAAFEVLEVRGQAEIARVSLVRLLAGRLRRLRLGRGGRDGPVLFVQGHSITMPTVSSKHARRLVPPAAPRSAPGVPPARTACGWIPGRRWCRGARLRRDRW